MKKQTSEAHAVTRRRTRLAIAAGTLGGFMALLDTSIVNSSLPVIQGEIGATQSEATWVGTAYLLAEIVILPLTAWIERMLGMRRFLLWSAILFTGFSVLCGSATSLGVLIFGRLGQGLSGGMMIPSAYSLVGRLLPPEEQSRGIAAISVPILSAPVIGPLIGGWLTEHLNWHYAFFINVPICAILLLMLFLAVERSEMNLHELSQADWFGIAGVTTFLGCLTVLLEEGHIEQWFDSPLIWKLAFGAAIGLLLLTIGQFRARRPVVKLALLRHRAVAAVMVVLFGIGVIMYSTLFVVPQFLVAISGYNALQAGLVMTGSGISSLSVMFIYPLVMKHGNLKLVTFCSMLALGLSCMIVSDSSIRTAGSTFLFMLLLWGSSIALTAIPLNQVAITLVAPQDIPEISSFITIARNLGGSVGLAAFASFEEARLDFHHWRISETLNANDGVTQEAVASWATMFGGGAEGESAALRAIDSRILLDALVMTFNDTFVVLALVAALIAPLGLLIPSRLPDNRPSGPAH